MTVIGYQGIPGANSEAAAAELAAELGLRDAELLPLVNSRNVVDALASGRADYGVVATRNAIAGPVGETEEALLGRDDVESAWTSWMPIHHCLFALRGDCRVEAVSSHVQALMQCRGRLAASYPGAEWIETDDTSLSARTLAEGGYPDTVAVLCRRNAGEMFGLALLRENMEDDEDNMTEFAILRMRRR